jgi:hypothetical protein
MKYIIFILLQHCTPAFCLWEEPRGLSYTFVTELSAGQCFRLIKSIKLDDNGLTNYELVGPKIQVKSINGNTITLNDATRLNIDEAALIDSNYHMVECLEDVE